jgi:menaquinone-specific isochorismate synthase
MLAPLELLPLLEARLAEGLGALDLTKPHGLASLVLPLPQAPALPPEIDAPRFGLIHGRHDRLRAGYGVAAEWQAHGSERLAELRCRARALYRDWAQIDPDETGFHGFGLLGFASDPWAAPEPECGTALPNALLWVPEVALVRQGSEAALILTTRLPATRRALRGRWADWLRRLAPALTLERPEPLTPGPLQPLGSTPNLRDWQGLVDATLAEIRSDSLRKAVLCRRVALKARRPFDALRLQAALTWLFPACQVIRIARGGTSFVAATPERLVKVSGGRVEVDALAGTAARSASSAQDRALTALLRDSPKDAREHALVVEAVAEALAGCCTDLEVPAAPRVMQLHNAQHLWSPIGGRLRPDSNLVDIAERLHPTPATNGDPRLSAREWLSRVEPFQRGWYTGAAGILEPDLSGELWVLLRCAEVRGDTAHLFAGAGIVAGSDPLSEWRETGHKLSAMATALRFA